MAGVNLEIAADHESHRLLAADWLYAGLRRTVSRGAIALQITLETHSHAEHEAWVVTIRDRANLLTDRFLEVLLYYGWVSTGANQYALTTSEEHPLLLALNELASLAILSWQRSNGAATIHAALLSRGGRGLLLLGDGHSGKTTLALGLAARGWTFLGDDACIVTRSSTIQPLPLRVNLRRGSWELLRAEFPELVGRYERAFAQRERVALDPVELFPDARPEPCRPTWLITLEGYGSESGPALRRLSPGEALARVVQQLRIAPAELLERLEWARSLVSEAECYALRAGNLPATLAAIAERLRS